MRANSAQACCKTSKSTVRETSKRHHRSMAKEAIAILEAARGRNEDRTYPPPVKLAVPMTDEFLNRAKRLGRA